MSNPADVSTLRRARRFYTQGQESIQQVEHVFNIGAKMVTAGVLGVGKVITADPSSAPVLVSVGSLVRLQVSADTYVSFVANSTDSIATSTTSPALKLSAGYYLVVATDNFLTCSANPTRIEVMMDMGAY